MNKSVLIAYCLVLSSIIANVQVQKFILEQGELPDPSIADNEEKWLSVFLKDWPNSEGKELAKYSLLDVARWLDEMADISTRNLAISINVRQKR